MNTPRQEGSESYVRALASARSQSRSGAGTVLDVLLRHVPRQDHQSLMTWLRSHTGIVPLADDADAVIDEVQPMAAPGTDIVFVALQVGPDRLPAVGLADPWDDERVALVTRAIGTVPALAAVTGRWLPERRGGNQLSGTAGAAGSGSGAVVDFVDTAVNGAIAAAASDIHFESDRQGITVKLRLDGVMQTFARMDDALRAEEVISRIKVLAQLDITERRVPQDGRFRFGTAAGDVDLRVSIMPSVHGEDAVLRLLDKAQLRRTDRVITLERLGFAGHAAEALRELAELPHGMLLVTGPTGSGKTTTVYALLSEVNQGLEKIVTIEDPVEYELPGVLQIPVNDRKGLTFARGLRSILRHDPDRILVGEIRDPETAEIAVQSSLTGHQVFTTVHANHLFDVIGRFRHFDIDMHGFMSALNGVVVQRLVRLCCPHCTGTRAATERERRWLSEHGVAARDVPATAGCERCRQTGYAGRGVIAEVHCLEDDLRDLVTSLAPLGRLREHVQGLGVPSLHRQAATLVAEGRTTIEEIRRVVGWR